MDIRKILKKIQETETPKVNKVAVAYSGGLDSSLAIELLRRKYKAKRILPITIDVGQGEEEVTEGRRKARVLKIKPLFFDLRKGIHRGLDRTGHSGQLGLSGLPCLHVDDQTDCGKKSGRGGPPRGM